MYLPRAHEPCTMYVPGGGWYWVKHLPSIGLCWRCQWLETQHANRIIEYYAAGGPAQVRPPTTERRELTLVLTDKLVVPAPPAG